MSKHLKSLEEKGFLRRSDTMSRPIDVRLFLQGMAQRKASEDSVDVPVVGDIAAGSPILAEEHTDDMLNLPRDLVGRGTVFGLRVRGDSMIDAAICDGDIVVIRQQQEAHSGEMWPGCWLAMLPLCLCPRFGPVYVLVHTIRFFCARCFFGRRVGFVVSVMRACDRLAAGQPPPDDSGFIT